VAELCGIQSQPTLGRWNKVIDKCAKAMETNFHVYWRVQGRTAEGKIVNSNVHRLNFIDQLPDDTDEAEAGQIALPPVGPDEIVLQHPAHDEEIVPENRIPTFSWNAGRDLALFQLQFSFEEDFDRKKPVVRYPKKHSRLGEAVFKGGGLHVVGSERHDARRIDRQLRGRAGRQGDPGSSRFFLSLEDDLMRLFGSERIASVMDRLGAEEGEVIEHSMVTKSIERAQKKVEARNFEIRKHLLEYDDVMTQQRQVIYSRRRELLERDTAHDQVLEMVDETVDNLIAAHAVPVEYSEEWEWEELQDSFTNTFFIGFDVPSEERASIGVEDFRQRLVYTVRQSYKRRLDTVGPELFHQVEKAILLHTVDSCWQEHLYEMDELKESVGFAGVGGKNPLIEYKKGAFDMFEQFLIRVDQDGLRSLFQLRIDSEPPPLEQRQQGRGGRLSSIHREATNLGFSGSQAGPRPAASGSGSDGLPAPGRRDTVASGGGAGEEAGPKQPVRVEPKVGRNAPCPCGSGKKYKQCCGRNG